MAGMLPGVECARRRKLHQNSDKFVSSNSTSDSLPTRKSFLCLYATSHEYSLGSSLSKERSATRDEEYQDEKLGEVASEAKQRLDEKLTAHRKSQNKRSKSRSYFFSTGAL